VNVSEVGFGQKIDQIVCLVREQAKETAVVKEELCSLRADMKELHTRLSESVSSTPSSLSGSSTSGSTHKKSKIPTQLSALVKVLHENAETSKQLVGSEPYNSALNQSAKEYLVSQLTEQCSDKYSPKRIQRKCVWFY
jgi:hypothetical protein